MCDVYLCVELDLHVANAVEFLQRIIWGEDNLGDGVGVGVGACINALKGRCVFSGWVGSWVLHRLELVLTQV